MIERVPRWYEVDPVLSHFLAAKGAQGKIS